MNRKNAAAMKLPDQLLARYFREGRIDQVKRVVVHKTTRDVKVTLADKTVHRWQNLEGVGWVPEPT